MKVLVTGGAGFIGSNYLHYVVNAYPEDEYVCIDALTYAGNYENLIQLENKSNFRLYNRRIQKKENGKNYANFIYSRRVVKSLSKRK